MKEKLHKFYNYRTNYIRLLTFRVANQDYMNLKPEFIDGVSIYRSIDLDEVESIVAFRSFWDKEFKFGQEIIFIFHRRESLTDYNELRNIENDLLNIFNRENFYILDYLDERRFEFLFSHEYQFGSSSLVLKFWKYFYSMLFFIPKRGVGFDDVISYFETNHGDNDVYLRTFMSKGFTDCTYIKGLGGDTLIKNSLKNARCL